MERQARLTRTFIERVKEPGRYSDKGSYGLSLLVKASTSRGHVSKSWSQALRFEGQQYRIGLGSFPLVSLDEARDSALDNARLARKGQDLRAPKEREKPAPTFAECLEQAVSILRLNWKNEKTESQLRSYMRLYVLDSIGRKRIDQITPGDILDILTSLAIEKPAVADKLQGHLSLIFRWAVGKDLRPDNPANGNLNAALPKRAAKKHFKALPYAQVADALQIVQDSAAHWSTKAAFEFLVLTAARSGEIREATWDEIEGDTWTIPAERMKAAREHRIPLSAAALAVLGKARQHTGGVGLIFPSLRGKPMTDATMSKLLRENDIAAVPHGFRSSFRDWAAESGVDRQVAESSLAHTVGNATETAYLRTTFFDLRRQAMEEWAVYLGQQP